jgi:O-antigen/teichoic acid export membrane protein
MINFKSSFYFLGNIIGQAISLITAIFIIKNISPEQFGRFSVFTSVGSIIGSIATLKFELSIAISSSLTQVYEKFNFSIFVSIILNLLMVSVSLPFLDLGEGENVLLLFFFAISVSLTGIMQQVFLYRENHIYNGLLSIILSLLNFLFILYIFKGESLLIKSNVYTNIIAVLVFFIILRSSGFKVVFFSIKKLKVLFKNNIEYPKFILPGSIATILLTYFHPILLSLIFSDKEVGVFSFSLRILLLPTIVIGAVTSGLLRAKLSKLYFDKNFLQFHVEVVKAIKLLIFASIFCYIVLVLVINNLSLFININKWKGLESASMFMLFYCVAQFFYVPLSNIAMVLGENKRLLKYNIAQIIITTITYLLTYIFNFSFYHFLTLLSAIFFVFACCTCTKFYYMSISKSKIF